MRVLALDIGKVRCGIAVSDPAGRVATPVCVLPTSEVEQMAPSFKRLLQDWEPEALLSGLPYSLDGTLGSQAKRIQRQASIIAQACNLPLYFCDERLSSTQAKRSLREKGIGEKGMRGKVDMIAASLFLQAWLDAEYPALMKEASHGE